MKLPALTLLTIATLAVGCGDDSSPGDTAATETGTTTDASTTEQPGDETTTGSVESSEGAAEQGQSGSGGGNESSSTGTPEPVTEVMVSGVVEDRLSGAPIVGAEISLYEMEGITTTSDENGDFTIGPVPADSALYLVIEPSEGDDTVMPAIPGYAGAIRPVTTEQVDVENVEAAQVQQAIMDAQLALIADEKTAIAPDLEQAILLVFLQNTSALGTQLRVDPEPVDGTYYGPNADGGLVVNLQTFENNLIPLIVYYNLPQTEPGTITVTAENPERECETVNPTFPTLSGYITLAEINCPPPA